MGDQKLTNVLTVLDLSRNQLLILKREYLYDLANRGLRHKPLHIELLLADHIVSNEELFNEFDGVTFFQSDFEK